MSVQFQPQIWGDKILSPITKAIQAERDRQHQTKLADARNNLQQQQIDMQKSAYDRKLKIDEQNSNINKQLLERQQIASKNKKAKEDFQTNLSNGKRLKGWSDRYDYERRYDADATGPGSWLGKAKDAFDAIQFFGKEDYARDAVNSLKWGDAPSPLKINAETELTDNMLQKVLSNQRLKDMTVEQQLQALRGEF